MFKLWSENNRKATEALKPDLEMRSLGECDTEERIIILKHFINKGWFSDDNSQHYVDKAVQKFSDANKASNFCPENLKHGGPHYSSYSNFLENCCKEYTHKDFRNIFLTMSKDIVYELLSYYVNELNNSDYYKHRDRFRNCFNDISDQFLLDIIMIEDQFIPRQEEKIIKEIYEPTLAILGDEKWEPVNRDLTDAFFEYRKNTPQGYSGCVTNVNTAVQAFLQIIVDGKIGGSDGIKSIIQKGTENGKLPTDKFTTEIFKNIETILMRERGKSGNAHPKQDYADEKSARMMLNLAMVFMQHCIQK
ncbi:hypothetical protein C4572_04380 [Candidatus Parcubacteria bacterium]|nr:MAG: hypothetical protein C4572_04380 [Candidatus Parcubacteria bacterium]